MDDSDLQVIQRLDEQIDEAWARVSRPTQIEICDGMTDIGPVASASVFESADAKSLITGNVRLDVNSFWSIADQKCRLYFIQFYLKHMLHLLKTPNSGVLPNDSGMFDDFRGYLLNKKDGLLTDRHMYTDSQYETIKDVIKFAYARPQDIATGGFDEKMISQYL